MIPYFIMMGIPAILAISFSINNRNNFFNRNQIVIDSFFLLWILILIFRHNEIGIDLSVYKFHFRNYASMEWKEIIVGIFTRKFEATYVLISKIIGFFTNEFQWILVVCALLSVIPIWILYRKDCKHGYLMTVLFVNIAPFAMYFSGLRQTIAIALAVPCYYYCQEKKYIRYLITIVFAVLTHKSAFILLLLYPVYHLKIKKQGYMFLIIPIIGIIYAFSMPIFNFLIRLFGTEYMERYSTGIKATGAYSVWLLLTILLVFSFLVVDTKKLDSETAGLRNLLILSVVMQSFSRVHTLAMRMNYYYLIFIPLLIPRIIERGKDKYRPVLQLALICMSCFFAFYYFYRVYTGTDDLGIYPYRSIFSNY